MTARNDITLNESELKSARSKYDAHARCSGRVDREGKPIEMRLTFDQWLGIWLESGHWHERGNRKGQYCMSRRNDTGHYELGNVFIQPTYENAREGSLGQSRPKISAAMKGKKRPNLSEAMQGHAVSTATREKIAAKLLGRTVVGHPPSEDQKRQLAKANKKERSCPHCGKIGKGHVMNRWHFDRCRSAPVFHLRSFGDVSAKDLEAYAKRQV